MSFKVFGWYLEDYAAAASAVPADFDPLLTVEVIDEFVSPEVPNSSKEVSTEKKPAAMVREERRPGEPDKPQEGEKKPSK